MLFPKAPRKGFCMKRVIDLTIIHFQTAICRMFPIIYRMSAMVAGEANAQGLKPPFIEYAAKFTCGPVPPPGSVGGGDADVVVGVYATSINIHNPQADTEVP